MAFSRFFLSVNFPLLFLLIQNNILNSSVDNQCVNPSFGEQQKITVEFFFSSTQAADYDVNLCELINKSNGLINIKYRMTSDMTEKATCAQDLNCLQNRQYACNYKFYQTAYNDCNASVPTLGLEVADCICAGDADDILIANQNSFNNYKIDNLPALAVEKKFDPCLTDFTVAGLKTYFCKAYNNKLPACQN